MSVLNWCLLGAAVVAIGLYVLGNIKNYSLLRKISSGFVMPFLAALNISLLTNYLPDSMHIIITTVIVGISISIAAILFIFDNIKTVRIFFHLVFLFALLVWIELYRSTFYLYRVPGWLGIVCLIFYAGIAIGTLVVTGRQKIYKYISYIIALIIPATIHFSSFILLCFSPAVYSVLLFSGSTFTLALIIFYTIDNARFHFKYRTQINFAILIISQSLIAYSNLLMIK